LAPIDLASAGSYAVLAGASVTNTGATTLNGDLGVNPGLSVTGFPPGTVNGTINEGNAAAAQAESDLSSAYTAAANLTPTQNLSGENLGGQSLAPGVYSFNAAAQLTGTLVLNGAGTYVFQIGSTLTTESGSAVDLAGDAQAGDVFWQVGTSATLGTNTNFAGSVLAGASITADTGATADGGLLAMSGTVSLDDNSVQGGISAVPEPASASLLLAGFTGLIIGVQRIRRHGFDKKPVSRGC
jgi:hypothetical protein